jgi:two-component system LytT family sensor kinase
MRGRTAVVIVVFAAWTALAVFFSISTSLIYASQGRPPLWLFVFGISLAQWWPWVIMTLAVVWVTRRVALSMKRLWLTLPVHLTASVAIAMVTIQIQNLARTRLLGVQPFIVINNLGLQILIYWALVALTAILDRYVESRSRAAAAETQLSQTQLELLRVQLQPHFLFNALNAISELIHEDPDKAEHMIGLLSDLLRAALDTGRGQLVPLSDEVGLLERYLDIQRTRFGSRLDVRIDIPGDCAAALVPHLCLQPLAENAIRHGLSPRASGGTIWIGAAREADRLVLTVADDGLGVSMTAPTGIGVSNTRTRLASLYGDRASFTLEPRIGSGTVATLAMPLANSNARAVAS